MNMHAMVMHEAKKPLQLTQVPVPKPNPWQVLIKVSACSICRTDLHIIDGELPSPKLPLILGHQIVGYIVHRGEKVTSFQLGARIGVPWLGGSCGACSYCLNGQENLCDNTLFTGYQIDGGFAEYCVADSRFIFPLPSIYSDIEAAPLLCAGLIGFRALRMANFAKRIGFYGFGSSAQLLTQVATYLGLQIYAFTREGDFKKQEIALQLGAVWASSTATLPPVLLDAAILFAPTGSLVPQALRAVKKGGTVVCAEIHMSDIPSFPYSLLWGERVLRSVANLTLLDAQEFLAIVPAVPVKTETHAYPLKELNRALDDVRQGKISGSAVIIPCI